MRCRRCRLLPELDPELSAVAALFAVSPRDFLRGWSEAEQHALFKFDRVDETFLCSNCSDVREGHRC